MRESPGLLCWLVPPKRDLGDCPRCFNAGKAASVGEVGCVHAESAKVFAAVCGINGNGGGTQENQGGLDGSHKSRWPVHSVSFGFDGRDGKLCAGIGLALAFC